MAMGDNFRRLALGSGAAATIIGLGVALLSASSPVDSRPLPPLAAPVAGPDLSVLSYNVKGLPWPLAINREGDLERIGERLAGYRRAGRQPAIVVLQEAFTDSAKRIGAIAGYRHVVAGPGRDALPGASSDMAHRDFVAAGSPLTGEGIGKQTDSGLMILSDYPVLAVRRAPFPAHACAGFDCLANKGMVMALVAVPGLARPVAIVTTHLNARSASGVDLGRAFQAYRWQIETLDGFVREARALGAPVILAGDLNVGKSPPRRALMQSYAARWSGGEGERGSLDRCFAEGRACRIGPRDDARQALTHNKDWQIAIAGGGVALRPRSVEVPFGREPGGGMLSDHVGYVVHYRIDGASPPQRFAGRSSAVALKS